MPKKKQSILVVDDEPDVVESLYDTFIFKYNVFKAFSAKEALEIINNNEIDLVISDQRMPEITGVELFAKMEKDHPRIGKVLLTGYSNIHAAVDAINKGHVDKYIAKPWEEDDIMHIILEVMDTRLRKVIEARKQADQQLKKSEQKLRDALELSTCVTNIAPNSHIIANSEGIILSANPATENIFGYKTEELIGKNVSLLAPSTKHDEYKRYIEDYLNYKRSGKPEQRRLIRVPKKCKAIMKNSEEFSILIYIREAKVKDEVVFVGIIEDITKHKQEEEKLRKTQDYIRSIIDCSLDMIISVDQNRRIVEFNNAAEKAFGYKKEEVIGKNIEMFYASSAEAKAVTVMFEGRDHLAVEIMNKRRNGEVFPVFLSASLLKDKKGNVIGSMGVSRDITTRKFVEKELWQAKKSAEIANKAKAEFLANMSHEIRTPLNGIIGMAELLIGADIKDDQMKTVRTLYTEAVSLLDIINDVLDFSKIESGKLDLEEIPFDLRITIGDLTKSFAHIAEQKGLEFNCLLSPDIPFKLIGDPVRLRQILVNLIGNALKFTHKGEIFIKIEMAEDPGNDRIKIRFLVIDTGIGIPKNKQKSIFDSFGQADGSTTRQYGGTGLGITISKQLAEQMGGEIGVESDAGKGSKFYFTVVFTKQEKQEDQKSPALDMRDTRDTRHTVTEARKAEDFQILLVEDYPTNQQVAMRHLNNAGYQVDLSENGLKGVEAYKKEPYDIILMDIQMPVMDGYEATAKIRAYEEELKNSGSPLETRAVIIAMTAHAQKKDREKCLKAGMDDYISKPLKRRELLALVDKWVNKIADSRSSINADDTDTNIPQAATTENRQSSLANGQSQKDVPIDLNRAIDEFEGDKGYLMEVLKGFLQNVSKQIKTIRQAISEWDAEVVRKEAHSIKGGAANLTADNLSRIASDLENIGKSGALAKGTETLEKLENEFHRLEDYVKGINSA